MQVQQYDERQRGRLAVRPGITGWAQVNGRAELPWTCPPGLVSWGGRMGGGWRSRSPLAGAPWVEELALGLGWGAIKYSGRIPLSLGLRIRISRRGREDGGLALLVWGRVSGFELAYARGQRTAPELGLPGLKGVDSMQRASPFQERVLPCEVLLGAVECRWDSGDY